MPWYISFIEPILKPVLNFVIILSNTFGDSFGVAVIILTVIINIILFPLTLNFIRSQVKQREKMKDIQPKMKAVQARLQEVEKKYANDKVKLKKERNKILKDPEVAKVMNPLNMMGTGCLWQFIQFPVWWAVYGSIFIALAPTPERLFHLSHYLYSSESIWGAIPLNNEFLFFDLAQSGSTFPNIILVILMALTMWATQRLTTATQPQIDPQQQRTAKTMQWLMPIMFGLIFLMFPSGLILYIMTSNLIRMIPQYLIIGRGAAPSPILATQGGEDGRNRGKR
jgi:YidC/Oxa1 family membrane protein insertase